MAGGQVGLRAPIKHMLSSHSPQRIAFKPLRGGLHVRDNPNLLKRHQWFCNAVQDYVEPAVLPGTTKDFPIPADKLIELTKKYASSSLSRPVGADDDSILADDFRFEGPLVKLDKKKYLEAVRSFDFLQGVPNINSNMYDFRVDKYEPQRVWYTIRVSGTHTGTLKVFKSEFKPTGRKVLGAPECASMTFNAEGKVTSLTGGYVIDNRLGTCNKLGGLFGILSSMGIFVPHPQSGTLGWKVGTAVDTFVHFLQQILSTVTFGAIKGKEKLG